MSAPRFFRCMNPKCSDREGVPGHDFTAVEGTCDRCGISSKHPRFGNLIVAVSVVHFDPPSEVPGYGLNALACDPARPIRGHMATGDPDAVNCPACRGSEAWRAAAKGKQVDPRFDVPLTIDPAAGVIRKADS